jgi:hypothetical protein
MREIPIPVPLQFKAPRLLGLRVRIWLGNGYLSLLSVVCYEVEVSASG